MTTTTTLSAFEIGKTTLDLARSSTLKLIEDIPQDKLTFQPIPKTNHALWILGHCAVSDESFPKAVGSQITILDASWGELFGMGSTPIDDPRKYPSLDEITTGMERAREALLEWFGSMDEAALLSPLPDDWKTFGPNFGGLMNTIAWHEGIHTGQLSAIRRALDLPNVFG